MIVVSIGLTKGTTHLLLPSCGSEIVAILPDILAVVAPSLVVLDLSDNDLPSLPDAIQHSLSLEELNVSENPLRALPSWIGDLCSLRVLQVDGCQLQNLSVESGGLTNLHTICGEYWT